MKQADKVVGTVLSLEETHGSDNFESEIRDIEAESMGWVNLSEGAYFHEGSGKSGVIQVVGIAQTNMSESNILWLL